MQRDGHARPGSLRHVPGTREPAVSVGAINPSPQAIWNDGREIDRGAQPLKAGVETWVEQHSNPDPVSGQETASELDANDVVVQLADTEVES